MARVPMTQREWIKLLESHGWLHETGGKHQVKMTKQGRRPITLPANKRQAYSKGMEAALRRQVDLPSGGS